MIPITVSFFINRQDESRRASLMQATVFCLGIVVLFTGLGLLIKTIAGPFGVVRLGSSPWVNGFIALVFFAFGFSLLGAFELTLPNNLLTKLNSVSQGSSYISTLLMGLTFSLTSFACVGPIVGPLLIASVQSNGIQPMLGMMCFATGLAAPFFLLALFPSYLRRLPKSGSWMLRVKVVLGFVVLAAALKYLSNVDQVLQLGFLTRTRILAAWIILFGLAGLYLLGRLRIEGIKPDEPLTVTRTALGALFLTFALSLMPGLFGAPLGEIDAYVPASGPTLGLSPGAAEAGLKWLKNDYDLALSEASKENKVVLVNFTGYACTNCHWMKANMFTRPEMRDPLHKFILVDLYTDGDDAESQKNQALENKLFSTVAIPFYAIFSAKGEVLGTFPGLTRNPAEFLSFLNISERRDSRAGDLPEAGSSAPPTHKLVDEMRQSADEGPVFRM
jgi:thiol:disulfide interchange protein DsbD